MNAQHKKTPLLLLPFALLWSLFSFVMRLTGRIIAAVAGLAFMVIGITLSVTMVAAPIGIPLASFGFLLLLRSIF